MSKNKLGTSAGLYLLGMGVGVIFGVITFQIVANITGGMIPAPTGLNKTIIDYIPTFVAIATMMLPVGAIWISGA
jgi:hypothetical protein